VHVHIGEEIVDTECLLTMHTSIATSVFYNMTSIVALHDLLYNFCLFIKNLFVL